MFGFEGRNALIFGAGQNIGRQVAIEFARRGATIAIADINKPGADETARLIAEQGGRAIAIAADVSQDASVVEAVAAAEEYFGDIDVLMNNVGIIHTGNPEDIPLAEWQRLFNINYFGALRATLLVMPKMIARKSGYIVNTGSFAGLYPYATSRVAYAATKAAIISMSENLALHLAEHGVRVSVLCPGPTMTRLDEAATRPWSANVVMRGPGSHLAVKTQEDVASLLADAMIEGRILVPTHEEGWDIIRELAKSPDDFIRRKVEDHARGETGLPTRMAPTGKRTA